ncbi:hypothetical protein M406DRAFT_69321 [Cryphonectria parasitica EP155]|uniref:Heterokaryon incompatibility domain-containing protein n=1 Tax=Cryphonectria parasitica (strain ATCC 38755 / EP155) TaxID=660469 RepID=A0A9P4Y657_CRYP1|nr:uncharacterized protein M406DRAFT_69321 [Cryphonectria parasitica EP155]KAF3767159.1 hypothetical protein M406DRAFT_69321 [Cryphonectria parasitica EP155]
MAHNWLADCSEENSAKCPQNKVSALPTRLVDVGLKEEEEPRLDTTAGETCAYMALSYCWGKDPTGRKLTSVNKSSTAAGVPVDELPATVREAGQDAPARTDWEREAVLMEQIYSRARLTISATATEDAQDGLFQERLYIPEGLPSVKAMQGGNEVCYVWNRLLGSSQTPEARPLDQRSWAFQEMIFSCRIISFGVVRLSWQCSCGSREEYYLKSRPHIALPMTEVGRKRQAER